MRIYDAGDDDEAGRSVRADGGFGHEVTHADIVHAYEEKVHGNGFYNAPAPCR